ncbi:ribonuclease III [Thermosipho ferrireducens]|uniref:ribonuclease III n=1 Tax=Thermosipho ferrireducens TaxID=2571116 RepID=UPI00224BA9E3|nr:ribonuclease III [Thermosipho ferrireducens]
MFTALCHTSYANEMNQINRAIESNERLEFLGDAVIELLVCETLYKEFPESSEGEMSQVKSAVASEETLSEIAKKIRLGHFLFLGKGEEKTGGRTRNSILADTLEAIAAALYLDGGFQTVKNVLKKYLDNYILDYISGKKIFDYKTKLQELTQELFKCLPKYKTVENQRGFTSQVIINGTVYGIGQGISKKEAEKIAAEKAVKLILNSREV